MTQEPGNAAAMAGLLRGQTHRRNKHIFLPQNGEEYWDAVKGEQRWKCARCPPHKTPNYSLKSTCNVLDHLEHDHHLDRKTGELIPAANRPTNRPPGQSMLQFTVRSQRYEVKFHHRVYKAKLLDWIINDNIGFRMVGSKRFISVLQYLLLTKPSIPDFIHCHPRHHSTIQR